jgi:hypothetical protein
MYRDDIADSQWQQNFNYGVSRDNVADEQWNKTFDYNSDWDTKKWDYETSIYDKESAKEDVWKYISLGVDVSQINPELIAKAGMTPEEVALAAAAVQAENNKKQTTKDGGYVPYKPKKDDKPKLIEGEETSPNAISLGIGPISDDVLLDLAEMGVVIIDENGNIRWAEGWNKDNYQQALTNRNNLFPSLNFSF